ncbi:helix-turn-helix domain-containing protein [Streptomyces sp. ASQP_92]|uniref:helix-turn-helix domain-containing protein n=1 Tax=Streptomyces sp. ASQP_92 TaxID=2979116 RepID=UPI0021C190DD|nr:helix-turn-helix domain-containing protein [Streptomyces sp. ASQP_92]MCT9092512.1 helix-turn-helix domain-containing protein [Streptomyces sp. ASQP_92]
MRSHEMGQVPTDHEAEDGWEVAHPLGGSSLAGVRMAGFRDRIAAGLDKRVLAQPSVVVVIGLGDTPFTVEDDQGAQPLTSFAATLSPGPARVRGERVECVEMRLSPPAAYTLLGVSPNELTRPVISLEDVWGPAERRLREQLAEGATWQERLVLVDEFLMRRAAQAPAMASEVAAVWDHIVACRGRVRVAELATLCGWSRKRLWSRFSAQIGLTPKRAAMLVRFDHAARALRAGENAIDVALACGYVDQPHLHRDVLAFAGCTPRALAEGPRREGGGS